MRSLNPWAAKTARIAAIFSLSLLMFALLSTPELRAQGGLRIDTTALPSGVLGQPYSFTVVGAGGTPPYTWDASSLPPGLSIGLTTGTITGTPTLVGSYKDVTIGLRDVTLKRVTQKFTLDIYSPLVITTTSLPSGTVGVAYSATLSAGGGAPPYSWSVIAGTLPAGLTLNAPGTITGTPTTAGTASFTVQVADGAGQRTPRPFSITIAPPPLSITTSSPLPTGTVGTAYSQTLTASGGTPQYSWTIASGTLPAGLSLSTGGVISGMPTTATTANFTVRVTDSGSQTATKPFSVTINPPPLLITTASPLPAGIVGTAYSQSLTASGGTPPYSWSVSSGTLPPGLTLSSATGVISGTPTTATTANFAARVTDSGSQTTTKSFSITVNAPLSITTASPLPTGTVGVAYSVTLAATSGTPPYTWSVSSGTLPGGLTLSSGGAINGTPATAGTVNFTVQVADSGVEKATKAFSVTINPPPLSITTSSPLPTGTYNAPYSVSLAATGGTPPYAWSVTSGSLPGGLTLSTSSGNVSGTPNNAGQFTFTAQVSDSSNVKATKSFSISIVAPPFGALSLTNVPGTIDPAQQVSIGLSSSTAQPTPVSGTLTLSFTSNSVIPSDDPAVLFSTGSRTVDFTIPSGSTTAQFPSSVMLLTGTVSGAVILKADIRSGPTGLLVGSVTIRPTIPKLTNTSATRTSQAITIQVTAYSPERKVTNVEFAFDVKSAAGTQRVTLARNVESEFDAWYRSSGSTAFGSAFVFVQAFTVQGDTSVIQSVTITLTNGQGNGSSAAVTIVSN